MKPAAEEVTKVNVADLPEEELVATKTGEKLTLAKSLSGAFGLTRLLIHQEVLLPGRRASSFHFHSEKEELFYVLSGQPSVYIGEKIVDLVPGDVIGFKPSAKPRLLFNRSQESAVILTVGTNPETDVITYLDKDFVRTQAH